MFYLIKRSRKGPNKVQEIPSPVEPKDHHFTADMAVKVLDHLYYQDSDGEYSREPNWSLDEIEMVTENMDFPSGTNKWDKLVAFNLFYADTCKVLNSRQALEAGYQYFFNDLDAPVDKLYRYVKAIGLI